MLQIVACAIVMPDSAFPGAPMCQGNAAVTRAVVAVTRPEGHLWRRRQQLSGRRERFLS
jgi:hypothetical protein